MVDISDIERSLQADIATVARIDAIPRILEVVCRTTGMGFAAVARVTEDRWVACSVRDDIHFGLRTGGELEIQTTICNEIRQHRKPVVIDHVALDETFCAHATPARYGFQSYISVPIMLKDGSFFGTLCALDPQPARLNTPEITGMFQLFVDLIAFHLDAQQRLATTQASLTSERETAALREQFIAVLGHDLRTPLSSIAAGGRVLLKTPLDEKAVTIVAMLQNSVKRMAGLIDNILDFARGRLGSGLVLHRNSDEPLQPMLAQVVDELQSAWPDRLLVFSADLTTPVSCDRGRIGQLLSNLISNALAHGAANTPVTVTAATRGGIFELAVTNSGDMIPAALIDKLFQPFVRAAAQPNQHGLGLGLYIASEIARAHGGTLTATSTADETRFTFTMPVS
ncbi:MAG: histidine kinase [Gammaproteobacteria bacterium]|jgi:signal transduction histidine kinase|nr:histidine kinase [Gammaproteobacteria bacterium]